MRPMIWKEFRLNEHWALLAMTGVLAALCTVLYFQETEFYHGPQSGLLAEEVQMVTIFSAAIVGAALGFLQMLPDRRRDHWALLVHRPMTRSQIFRAKVVSGLLLYALAMGVPFLFSVIWARTQMGVPFEWGMTRAGIADVLMGFSFYFAALLTSMAASQRHFFRIVSLATAGLGAAGVVLVYEFWMALVLVGLTWAILGTAAWGAFVSGGGYASQPRAGKMALGISLYTGLCICVTLLIAMLIAAVDTSSRSEMRRFSTYLFDARGRVLVAHITSSGTRYVDLQGNPVPDPSSTSNRPAWLYNQAFAQIAPDYIRGIRRYRSFDAYAIAAGQGVESLYYVRSARRIVVYSMRNREVMGWVGRNGFKTHKSEAIPFDELIERDSNMAGLKNSQLLLPCQDAVYLLNDGRHIETVYQPEPGDRVRETVAFRLGGSKENAPMSGFAISTSKAVILIDEDGKQLFRRPYDFTSSEYFAVRLVTPSESHWRLFLWYLPFAGHYEMPSLVVELTRDGKEIGRQTLPALPRPEVIIDRPWYDGGVAGLVPPIAYLAYALAQVLIFSPRSFWSFIRLSDLCWLCEQNMPVTITALGTMAYFSICAAALCAWLTRRYGFSLAGKLFWIVAGVLLGPMGYVTLLLLHDWPSKVPCPTCSKPRRVDREVCEHCGEPFGPMERRPGDIYDEICPQGSNEPAEAAQFGLVHS